MGNEGVWGYIYMWECMGGRKCVGACVGACGSVWVGVGGSVGDGGMWVCGCDG